MSIPIWTKSEYVTIGIALLSFVRRVSPSEKSEGKPPCSVVSHAGSISHSHLSDNIFFNLLTSSYSMPKNPRFGSFAQNGDFFTRYNKIGWSLIGWNTADQFQDLFISFTAVDHSLP